MFQKEVLRKFRILNQLNLSLLYLFLSLPPLSALDAEADGHGPRPHRATSRSSRSLLKLLIATRRHLLARTPRTAVGVPRRRTSRAVPCTFSPTRSRPRLALSPPLAAQTGLLPPPLLPSLLHAPSRALRGIQSRRRLPFAPPIPRLPWSSLLRLSSRPSNPAASTPTLRWCSPTRSPTPQPAGTPPPPAQFAAGRPSPRRRPLRPSQLQPKPPRGRAHPPLAFPPPGPRRRRPQAPESGRPKLPCFKPRPGTAG